MRGPVVVAAAVVAAVVAVAASFLLRSSPPDAPAQPPVTSVGPSGPAPARGASTPAPPAAAARERSARSKPETAEPESAPPPVPAAPTTGTLHVETDVEGATVFLDRVGVGTAPMTIQDVAPGSHRLNVSAAGYDGYAETIEVEPGTRTISIRFKEIRLDARIEAVHKHGMGSCRGVMSASPEGIRYQAADGKDSVAIGFGEVALFEVDYLAKNLRIRTADGRTFNFTDPAGNADRLFVFHRDVDKVRKRVLSQ